MSSLQRIIKYMAIAFAIFLTVSIVGGILSALLGIFTGIFAIKGISKEANKANNVERINYEQEFNANDTHDLKVDLKLGEIVIEESDDTENIIIKATNITKDVKVELENNKLELKDNTDNIFGFGDSKPVITVCVPKDKKFENVDISNGAGTLDIKSILADKVSMNVGAGKVDVEKMEADKLHVEGGAGKIDIKNASVGKLDLNAGVGKVDYMGIIKDNADIEGGVGSINIKTTDDINNYKVKASTGIGAISFNKHSLNDNEEYGDGSILLNVDGGVGSINIEGTRN